MSTWLELKNNINQIQKIQQPDGSILPEDITSAKKINSKIQNNITALIPEYSNDATYLKTVISDLQKWENNNFSEPDFLESIKVFNPANERIDGTKHLIIFPMYTQNGSNNRFLEALTVEVMWPEFIAEVEKMYPNKMFLSLKFHDYTEGYNTHSAVLFPETVAMSEIPQFTWGAIFQDREAARFRKVVKEAANITGLELPDSAKKLLDNQEVTQNTFILWDLIHDRTHMSGDLPFDPFMIKQRMPYFLYGLEELRCDLTAFRECYKMSKNIELDDEIRQYAELVQYAVIFDRIFRFACSGTRNRNYDSFAGQLLFAWMHKHGVLHWTNNKLSIDWDNAPEVVAELGNSIDRIYWESIDRPKIAHWLASYRFVSEIVTPHPASLWAKGADALPLLSPPKEIADTFMDDEFPLSMFYEALQKKLNPVIEATVGIRP
jgi:hypothetical protein